jgi:hypothetical protein
MPGEAFVYLDDDNKLGRRLTREQFVALDPGKVFDDLTKQGACGAPGVLFVRDDGAVGIEDANSVRIEGVQVDEPDDDPDDELFPVPLSVSRSDLKEMGFDPSGLSDDDMSSFADQLGENLSSEDYWDSLEVAAEATNIPRLDGGDDDDDIGDEVDQIVEKAKAEEAQAEAATKKERPA